MIKGGSSKWLHDTFPNLRNVSWQEGYGAFTIGHSQIDHTLKYIADQEEHHRTKSFEEEYKSFLEKHQITYDLNHVFG